MSGRKTIPKNKKDKAKLYKGGRRLHWQSIKLTTKIIKNKKKNILPLPEE